MIAPFFPSIVYPFIFLLVLLFGDTVMEWWKREDVVVDTAEAIPTPAPKKRRKWNKSSQFGMKRR